MSQDYQGNLNDWGNTRKVQLWHEIMATYSSS